MVLKKAAVAAGIAAVGILALSPLAFADDGDSGSSSEHVIQHPVQECDHHEYEGVVALPVNDDSHNSDSHDGDCTQQIHPDPDDF